MLSERWTRTHLSFQFLTLVSFVCTALTCDTTGTIMTAGCEETWSWVRISFIWSERWSQVHLRNSSVVDLCLICLCNSDMWYLRTVMMSILSKRNLLRKGPAHLIVLVHIQFMICFLTHSLAMKGSFACWLAVSWLLPCISCLGAQCWHLIWWTFIVLWSPWDRQIDWEWKHWWDHRPLLVWVKEIRSWECHLAKLGYALLEGAMLHVEQCPNFNYGYLFHDNSFLNFPGTCG